MIACQKLFIQIHGWPFIRVNLARSSEFSCDERRKETNKRKDKEGHEPLEMFTAIPGSKQMAHVMSYAKIQLRNPDNRF